MILLCSIILIGATACDTRFKPEAVLSVYIEDLNRSQFISIHVPPVVMPKSLPSLRDRQQRLTQFDIGLLDFLSLQHCDVGLIVGQKNSILGKVMPDSQRFLYELTIIGAIESCDIKNAELLAELRQVAKQKRRELPKAFSNAIFHGPESSEFFSLSNGFIPMNYSTANEHKLLSSLNQLVDIAHQLEQLPEVDGEIFEASLKVLSDSEYAGRALYSFMQITRYLNQVSERLILLDDLVCGAPLTYLKRQFKRHYVDVIQPYMARLNRSAYQVFPLMNQLSKEGIPLSKELKGFLDQFSFSEKNSVWHQYQQASQHHAKAWSELFVRCAVPLNG
ncbi:DUF3080 domain-containing protein [Marinomonas sp. C1424]|uniref:DUF3080 domain-containing protein n=2 Tax=Marinomonas transparens TaxID=2795388 RepID=A0A934MZ04_9GAMM|nr:DUF3080 domain-containing protein [Marinomonas transparens]